jgi:4-hydroxy 2-oxovalerate aldolase
MKQQGHSNIQAPSHLSGPFAWRPSVQILDCTVRDGGLINHCQFSEEFVRHIHKACTLAGTDYMEVGYKGTPEMYDPQIYGAWRFCEDGYLQKVLGEQLEDPRAPKLCAMADAGRCDLNSIPQRSQSVLEMIRVATYVHQIPTALEMIQNFHDKGYRTTLNLMALSVSPEHEVDSALELLSKSEADVIYVVDSFGSIFPEDVRAWVHRFRKALAPHQRIGIHAHNNQQLAFANSREAHFAGADLLDVTIGGLGRGAGNCPHELLLGSLPHPKYDLRPILECLQNTVEPLKSELDWGYSIPYQLGGQANEHPRAAMAWMSSPQKNDFLAFYDQSMNEEKP